MKKIQGEYGLTYQDMVSDLARAVDENRAYYNMVREEIMRIMGNDYEDKKTISVNIDTFKFLK